MKNENQIPTRILVKGLNWSGSGTVVELLKEYDGIVQIPGGAERIAPAGYTRLGEFVDFLDAGHVGDGLNPDIQHRHPSRIMEKVKQRNKQYSFLSRSIRIAQLVKEGHLLAALRAIQHGRQLSRVNKCLERLAVDFEQNEDTTFRLKRAQLWIAESIAVFGREARRGAVFDNAIRFGYYDDYWPIVFSPYKLITVHRDPRDRIAEQVRLGYPTRQWTVHLARLHGYSFQDAVNFQLDFGIASNQAYDSTVKELPGENTMLISFEKMVLDYEESKRRIQDFLGLTDRDHIRPKKFFKPEWSRRNIGVHKDIQVPVAPSKMEQLMEWYQAHLEE